MRNAATHSVGGVRRQPRPNSRAVPPARSPPGRFWRLVQGTGAAPHGAILNETYSVGAIAFWGPGRSTAASPEGHGGVRRSACGVATGRGRLRCGNAVGPHHPTFSGLPSGGTAEAGRRAGKGRGNGPRGEPFMAGPAREHQTASVRQHGPRSAKLHREGAGARRGGRAGGGSQIRNRTRDARRRPRTEDKGKMQRGRRKATSGTWRPGFVAG